MTKTLTQRTHYTCGPVALYNAMVLLGVKPPALKKLVKMCKTTSTRHTTKPSGTYFADMKAAARRLGLKWKRGKSSVHIVNYESEPGLKHIVVVKDKTVFNHWNGHRYVKKTKVRLRVLESYELAR